MKIRPFVKVTREYSHVACVPIISPTPAATATAGILPNMNQTSPPASVCTPGLLPPSIKPIVNQ